MNSSISKATPARPSDDFERKLQETLAMIKPIENIGVSYSASAGKALEVSSKTSPKSETVEVLQSDSYETPSCATDSEDITGASEIKSEEVATSKRPQDLQLSPVPANHASKSKTVVGRLPPSGKKATPKSADKRTTTPTSKPSTTRPPQSKTGEKSKGTSAPLSFSKEAEEFINSIPQVEVVNDDNSISSEW